MFFDRSIRRWRLAARHFVHRLKRPWSASWLALKFIQSSEFCKRHINVSYNSGFILAIKIFFCRVFWHYFLYQFLQVRIFGWDGYWMGFSLLLHVLVTYRSFAGFFSLEKTRRKCAYPWIWFTPSCVKWIISEGDWTQFLFTYSLNCFAILFS